MAAIQGQFDTTLLPATLQQPVDEALAREDYGAAAALINAHLAAGEARDGSTLTCLAVCNVEAARNGPFEQLAGRCAEALEWLDEARIRGGSPDLLRAARTRIKRIQKTEQELQALEATEPKMLDAATLTRTKNRAYALADRGSTSELLTSARLWHVLYRHAMALPNAASTSSRVYYFARAGLEFAQGRRFDLARPYLETTVEDGGLGSGYESWMVEYAYRELLLHAAVEDDRAQFEQLWWRAVGAAEMYNTYFPYARPSQDRFLEQALTFGLPDICHHLIAIIEEHRPKRTLSAEVRAKLAQARAYLAEIDTNAGSQA